MRFLRDLPLMVVIFLLIIFGVRFFADIDKKEVIQNNNSEETLPVFEDKSLTEIDGVIKLVQVDNNGKEDPKGQNYAILFNPKSPKLKFKVNVGLSGKIYDCLPDSDDQDNCEYVAKKFEDLVWEDNAKLNGKLPFAAINTDYIDELGHPQGFNVSQGVEYSGEFFDSRSSFAISKTGKATIQIGPRKDISSNYNAVGGNGCFWKDGEFVDICEALGEYACKESTERSMGAITSLGWVIFLVHDEQLGEADKLLPKDFEELLTTISEENNLGKITDGILFDGGRSPALMYDGQIYLQNSGDIGSVFLIYLND